MAGGRGFEVIGVRVPLELPSGAYGNDDPELIGLEIQVSDAKQELQARKLRKSILNERVAALTYLIDQAVVDGPGQSGAPV